MGGSGGGSDERGREVKQQMVEEAEGRGGEGSTGRTKKKNEKQTRPRRKPEQASQQREQTANFPPVNEPSDKPFVESSRRMDGWMKREHLADTAAPSAQVSGPASAMDALLSLSPSLFLSFSPALSAVSPRVSSLARVTFTQLWESPDARRRRGRSILGMCLREEKGKRAAGRRNKHARRKGEERNTHFVGERFEFGSSRSPPLQPRRAGRHAVPKGHETKHVRPPPLKTKKN